MAEAITERVTNRWASVDAVAWAAAAVGLLFREPGVLLVAAASVVFVAYARFGAPPEPRLRVRREVDDETPVPGQEVTVSLTVESLGDRVLSDVRLVDGVPSALGVLDGTPQVGTVLRPGESRTVTYTVGAERGTHTFDPTRFVCRSLNGAHEVECRADVVTSITCRPAMDGTGEPPVRSIDSPHSGRIPTAFGGSGVEFHGVREYRPGDRVSHVDWARRARTGELTTLEFREERMATAVLLIDARPAAYVRAGEDDEPHAVEWSVRAAADVFTGLLDADNRVGVAALGNEFAWLGPGAGEMHRQRARELLATHPTLSPSPARDALRVRSLSTSTPDPDGRTTGQLRRLDVQLPPDAQVFAFSPLADDAAVSVLRRVHEAGNAVTVVSPDVTGEHTPGARLEQLSRQRRIRELRGGDVRVVDCPVTEPLAVAFERAREAWR